MNRDLVLAACAAFVLLCIAVLPGCASAPEKPYTPNEDICRVWAPIIPSLDDSLTDSTATQVLTHNCVGYRLGCWNSPAMKEACGF